MKIQTFRIHEGMGQSRDWKNVPFLTKDDIDALNTIGYTGKYKHWKSKSQYLKDNHPDHAFSIEDLRFDPGEFSSELLLIVGTVEKDHDCQIE